MGRIPTAGVSEAAIPTNSGNFLSGVIRDRGSVFRPPPRTVGGDVFASMPERRRPLAAQYGQLSAHFVHVSLRPADGRDFDLAVGSDVEKSRDVGEAVGVGDGVMVNVVVDGDRERHAKIARKCLGVGGLVL